MAIKTYEKGSDQLLSKNFRAREFDCPCARCKTTRIDEGLPAGLQKMRDILGAKILLNGYRCPEHNAEVPNAAKASKHMQGMAADITVEGKTPAEVAACAERVGFKGIGLYDTFVHVDNRPNKSFWFGHQQEYRSTFGGAVVAPEKPQTVSGNTATVELPVIKKGDTGSAVRLMQTLLGQHGYGIVVDGKFGGRSEEALICFQEDEDLEADGIAGKLTWTKLMEV